MSYEYKTDIENSLFQYSKQTERYFEFTSWYDELQEVYERAAKADEYEAKARAFDRINQLTIDQMEHEQTYDEVYRKIDRVVSKLIEDIGTYESEAE